MFTLLLLQAMRPEVQASSRVQPVLRMRLQTHQNVISHHQINPVASCRPCGRRCKRRRGCAWCRACARIHIKRSSTIISLDPVADPKLWLHPKP